jgi:hypothetical protein
MFRKVAMGAVLLVTPPLTLALAVNDTAEYWLRAAIVVFTWTLGVALGTVLSSDIGSKQERGDQD